MNLATKLTWLRIFFVPIVIVLFYIGYYIDLWWALALAVLFFILAAITDFLDGHIARKYNLVTNLGKFLDPIADKILTFSCFLIVMDCGYIEYHIMAIATGVVVIREFAVSALRQIAATQGKVIAADKYGKVKTAFQDVIIPFMLLLPIVSDLWIGFDYIIYVLIFISTLLTVISGINYFVVNKSVFND